MTYYKFDHFVAIYVSVICPSVSSSEEKLNNLAFYRNREEKKVVVPSGLQRYKHLSEKFPSFQKKKKS